MTNSPPAKVRKCQTGEARVLASGIDSLNFAIGVGWVSEDFLTRLAELKKEAQKREEGCAGVLQSADGSDSWVFNLKGHGCRGYAYLLVGKEMTLKVGNWMESKQRPSVMVELRSEFLWSHGAEHGESRICELLSAAGGAIESVKVSRADLCADVLVDESTWTMELLDQFVTRAEDVSPHLKHRRLTGFSIGKGKISARLYDKPLEILTSSGKVWMYDVWGIERVPDGKRVIRVEFQLRREGLKELDINLSGDLFRRVKYLWAYLTQEWLKVQSEPGKHHTQRKTVAWWKVVQDGFEGALAAHPLIRAKAIGGDRLQLLRQLCGNWISMIALDSQGRKPEEGHTIELDRQVVDLLDAVEDIGLDNAEVTRRVEERLAKFQRERRKNAEAVCRRRALGISSGIPGHKRSTP